jgi:probable DNA repair protein
MALIDLIELSKNSIILTPNERLCRRLHKLFGEQMHARGITVWPTPPIQSLSTWYHQLYQNAIEQQLLKEILLSPLQYNEIWQQVIDNFLIEKRFLEPQRTVSEMMKALQTLKQWRVNYTDSVFNNTEESRLFAQCAAYVERILHKSNWLTADALPDRLCSIPLRTILNNTEKIILFAFDDITPQTQYFLDNLIYLGINVTKYDWHRSANTIKLHALPSAEQEYYVMAQWAKEQLAQDHQQIACIVPDLTSSRELIVRIFNEVFQPNLLFEHYASSKYFNISGGETLASLPMIKSVFNFLTLFKQEIDYAVLSNVLLSPFVAFAETEKYPRVELDLKLREKLLTTIYNHQLPQHIVTELCPLFNSMWHAMLTKNPEQKFSLPSDWIIWLSELLKIWGWPGERILNSNEYQQLEQWYVILDDITTLDDFCGTINFSSFVNLLNQAANNVKFQIKTTDAPVQVLGMLEASGSLYDCIWIAGLTDKTWPPVVQLNPYIPFEMQRRLNMPHASSQRQYDYSQQMMQRWLNSAPTLHFSYAESDGDEPLACSPLLKPYENNRESIPLQEWRLSQQLYNMQNIETIVEPAFLPFNPEPSTTFGSSLFEQQVNCPFQAFAKQRLNSNEFKMPQQSWDPRLRGTNIHAVMEKLWMQWQHSDILHQLSEQEINQQIEIAVNDVLRKCFKSQQHDFIQLEKERLLIIISKWLKIEKERAPFQVYAIESKHQTNIAGLTLNLKIDRIDKTDAGDWILIDYKANVQNVNDWLSSPPNKPQMLIYANVLSPAPDVVTYASLHPTEQKMKFFGLSRNDLDFPDVKPFNSNKNNIAATWSELLHHWQTQIDNIAIDFISGNVSIKPRTPDTCKHCHLASLCRINDK